jgi:hypothetical protein
MSSGGQQPVTQQTTQTKDPWSAAQPHLQNVMNSAANLIGSDQGYQPYTGPTQAPLDPLVTQGIGGQQSIAQGSLGGTEGILAAQKLGLQQIQEAGGTNPYLENILNTNNRRIGDRINSSMSGAGRYGSGQHTDVMARALAESADPILAEDYTAGLQRAGQWSQLMPTLDQAQYAPAQSLMALGQYNQDRAQAQLADQMKLYAAQQARPWEQLSRYNAAVGGAGGLGGTQITSSPIQQPSTLQRLLGGGLAGAGIGGSFGGPVGAAGGALGGGLLGLL